MEIQNNIIQSKFFCDDHLSVNYFMMFSKKYLIIFKINFLVELEQSLKYNVFAVLVQHGPINTVFGLFFA